MVAINTIIERREDRIAQLTNSAYQAILERGFRGSFLELELSIWNAIRHAVEQEVPTQDERVVR